MTGTLLSCSFIFSDVHQELDTTMGACTFLAELSQADPALNRGGGGGHVHINICPWLM